MKNALSPCPVYVSWGWRLKPFDFGRTKNILQIKNNVQQVLRLLVNYQITEIWSKHAQWSKSISVKQKESVAHRKKKIKITLKKSNMTMWKCENNELRNWYCTIDTYYMETARKRRKKTNTWCHIISYSLNLIKIKHPRKWIWNKKKKKNCVQFFMDNQAIFNYIH